MDKAIVKPMLARESENWRVNLTFIIFILLFFNN